MTISVTWKRPGSIAREAKRGWRKTSRNVKIAMLVPTSVTTRLTSRLAVSLPTVGPPSPLRHDACSIIKTVMNASTSRPGLHPAEPGERTTWSRSRRLSARFFPSDFVDDLRQRGEPVIRPEKFDQVSRGHIALFVDREVKSRTAAREEPPHHVQPPEPNPELVTWHPRLCRLQHGRSDAQPVSDAEGPLVETFRREILAERSPRKLGPPEFASPEWIVFARVRVDGLRGAPMDGRVRLAVADEAGSLDPDAALHGLLEDRRRDFPTSPFDGLRQGDVHGDDAHGIRPHGFRPMSASYPPRSRG